MSHIYVRYDVCEGKVIQPIETPIYDTDVANKKYVDDMGGAISDQSLNTTDSVTFDDVTTTTGVILPTTGGTQSTLDFYEEFQTTDTWTGGTGWSKSITVNAVRVGVDVTITVSGPGIFDIAQTTTSRIDSPSDVLPTRFMPSNTIWSRALFLWYNGTLVANGCVRIIRTGTGVSFEIGDHQFPNNSPVGILAGDVTFDTFSVSYHCDQ